ncbi:hypothetical protein O3P69_017299 [Scylla paramamosain]|uniref:C2H2-type domain-containing protein n=1 Tax=Scylla paramamosain TaxID=85552 RepID=A0AAW0TVF1_SCYPA
MTARRRPLPAATFSQLTPLSSRIPPQQSIFMSIIHLGGRSRVIPSEKITEKERDYRSSRPEPRDQGSLPPLSMTHPDSVFRPNFPLFLPFLDSRRELHCHHLVVRRPRPSKPPRTLPCSTLLSGERTNRRNNLSKHITTMHTKMMSEMKCCGITFYSKWEVKHHNRTVHSDGYPCNLCGRTFQRKDLLDRHFSIHTGEKKFKCATCSYGSSHKSNLKRHWRVHRGCKGYFTHMPEVMTAPACLETFSSQFLHTLRYFSRQPSSYVWSIEEGSLFPTQVRPTLQWEISPSVHHLFQPTSNWDLLDSLARPYYIRSSNTKGSLRQTRAYQCEDLTPPSPEEPTLTQLERGQLWAEAEVNLYREWETPPEADHKHQHYLGKHAPSTVVRPTPLRHYYPSFPSSLAALRRRASCEAKQGHHYKPWLPTLSTLLSPPPRRGQSAHCSSCTQGTSHHRGSHQMPADTSDEMVSEALGFRADF